MNTDQDKHKYEGDTALREAKDWLLKMQLEPITPEIHTAFQEWLAANPTHRSKFDQLNAIWEGVGFLKDHPLTLAEMKEIRVSGHESKIKNWLNWLAIRPAIFKPVAVLATILLVITGIWLTQAGLDTTHSYYTKTGEQKAVYLGDGSTIHLDAETKLITNYSENSRQIELKKGRASFSVVHDAVRPFVVSAGQVVVRALGTKFDVHKKEKGKISVSVTEGLVQVKGKKDLAALNFKQEPLAMKARPSQDPEKNTLAHKKQLDNATGIIGPGQKIVVDERKAACEIKPVDVNRVGSWKTGRLFYEMAPLSEVIEEINRYLEHKIIIEDDRLSDMPITVNFNIQHRKNFLVALGGLIPIDAKKSSGGQVYLRKRE